MNDSDSVAAGLGMLPIMLVVIAVAILLMVLYLLTLQQALNRCSPECRAMYPGMVWLMLIPLFGFVWHFFIVLKMAKSLGAEFQKRGLAEDPKPGQTRGVVMCILFCCCLIPSLLLVKLLLDLASLICWGLYWVRIVGYSSKIAAPPVAVAA